MTNKFEAGRVFLDLLQRHGSDFRAERQSGRDGEVIIVRHNFRDVVAGISITGRDILEPICDGNGKGLTFMDQATMKGIVAWAVEEIKRKKEQERIDKDSASINALTAFYGENNG